MAAQTPAILTNRGQWATGSTYAVGDTVYYQNYPVVCLVAHTAGTFTTDVTGGKWQMAVPMRNYVINGGMHFWQRGTTGTFTTTAIDRVIDRWNFWHGGNGSCTMSRQSPQNSIGYAMRVSRDNGNSGTTNFQLTNHFDLELAKNLAGKQVSISFRVRTGAGYSGTSFSASVVTGNGGTEANLISAGFTSQVASVTASPTLTTNMASTWVTATGTIPAGTNQLAINIFTGYSGASGLNDWFEIEQFMLNEGPAPAQFQTAGANMQDELAMCQRYYCKSYNIDVAPATLTTLGAVGYSSNGSGFGTYSHVVFPVVMRIAPSLGLTVYNPVDGTNSIRNNSSASNLGIANFQLIGSRGFSMLGSGTNDAVNQQFIYHWTASAEF